MATFLRAIPTYRLTLCYLTCVYGGALALGALEVIDHRPLDLAFSLFVLLATCLSVNWVFSAVFAANSNLESVCITALILALIITPFAPRDGESLGFAVFAGAWAMASKYLLAPDRRHIFNPAALGLALAGSALHNPVSWWVGDCPWLLPVIVFGGVLVAIRLRYFVLICCFAGTVAAATVVNGGVQHATTAISLLALHSMLAFFAFAMLTEPRTTPMGTGRRIAYAILVGALFSPSVHLGAYYFTPEVALLAGNAFSLLTDRKRLTRWIQATQSEQSRGSARD